MAPVNWVQAPSSKMAMTMTQLPEAELALVKKVRCAVAGAKDSKARCFALCALWTFDMLDRLAATDMNWKERKEGKLSARAGD